MGSANHRTKALAAAIAAVLATVPASVAAEVDFLESRLGVSDAVLAGIRGGIRTSDFFLTFAVLRTITINGTHVLTQQLAVHGLAEMLRSGVVPQVTAENLGLGVAVGSGNSLTSAIASQTGVNSAAVQAAATQQPAPTPAPTIAAPQQVQPAASQQQVAPAPAVQVAAPQAAPQTPQVQVAAPQPAAPPNASASTPQLISQSPGLTKSLVINIPDGRGNLQAMVVRLPDGAAIATAVQNSVSGLNLGISTTIDVNAKLLDAARSGQLQRDILNSIKLPH